VLVIYDKDRTKMSTVVDMLADDARRLVDQNRVRYVAADTPLGAWIEPEPEDAVPSPSAATGSAPAVDTPAIPDTDPPPADPPRAGKGVKKED
jgi:hypothetical protein